MIGSRVHINIFFSWLISMTFSCGDAPQTTVIHSTPQGLSNYTGDTVTVTGQLALGNDAQREVEDPANEIKNRQLEILDESDNKVAEAVTDSVGDFRLQIDTDGFGLQGESISNPFDIPKLYKINSLFLIDGHTKQHAVGIQQSIFLDKRQFSMNADGEAVMEAGTQQVRKVGAIVGQVQLENGGSAVGIDVYIPGTTNVAKTDADGRFLIGFLPAGNYTLRAETDGYVANEWTEITVEKGETTALPKVTLPIAIGPQIKEFSLDSIVESTGEATIHIHLHAATKYRISMLSDFSDTVFKAVDLANPEFNVKLSLKTGFKIAQIYLEAADSDGLSVNSILTIDRDPPKLGSISSLDSDGIINTTLVSLLISAEGATKMKLAENIDNLSEANWIAYAPSHNYSLVETTDGPKNIYISFADDAGNTLGANGELFTSFILDRTAPNDGKISLLRPESPTGAFNTPLAWQADYGQETVSYDIEVATTSTFSSVLRTMATTNQTINIDPPLTSEGQYHWRVRARDLAGNASTWVSSSATNGTIFEVKILAEAYHSKKDLLGTPGRDRFFGRELINIGDINSDGIPEIAYSILSTEFADDATSCQDCGVVAIADGASQAVLVKFSDGRTQASGYGHRLTMCDLTGDGQDELIVSAPGHAVTLNGVSYNNAGAIYAYNLDEFRLLAQYDLDLGSANPAPGYDANNCSQWDGNTCLSYGWPYYPNSMEYLPWGAGRYFGWDLSCMRQIGNPDQILVGEPKFHDGTSSVGRVQILSLSDTTLSVSATIQGTNAESMFGTSVQYLSRFHYQSCNTIGPTISIGSPRLAAGGIEKGSVSLYKFDNGWVYCDQIDADAGDPDYGYWGMRLSKLGDIDQDVNQVEELAVSSGYWGGGAVRIYGGSTGIILKSLRDTTSGWNRLGHRVVSAGDYDDDGQSEFAITAPEAAINGQWGAGFVHIYRWSDLDDDDDNNDGDADSPPYLTIRGIPSNSANLGGNFIPILADHSNMHSASIGSIIGTPGRNINGQWSVGAFHIFDLLKLAPSSPIRYEGVSTNARMGASISAISDVDNDNVSDIIIGQPGGRCQGKPYGMVSLFSVLDNTITSDICADYQGANLGLAAQFLPESNKLAFFKKGTGYYVDHYNILNYRDITNSTDYPSSRQFQFLGWELGSISENYREDTNINALLVNDPTAWNTAANQGQVTLYTVDWQTNLQCHYRSDEDGARFGYSSSFIGDLNGDGVRDILVGAPGYDLGSDKKGRVYIVDGVKAGVADCQSGNAITINDASSYVIAKIDANDPMITAVLGKEAEAGFGSFTLGLPDFDGADDAIAYIYVANTNIKVASSSVTPQFFIFAYDGTALTLVKHAVGEAGAMMGGYAKVIEDINGDGIPELAVSSPGGSGRFGNTGNVRIYSGAGIASTSESSDDLLQSLFNPDPTASNFGISFEYADITGDGLLDFLVGADQYDSSSFQNAGAVYAFPMNPIQE
ncbi:MAG: carboxypeptidase regulatory-like domain-containing protein [Oligoflexus sp.]